MVVHCRRVGTLLPEAAAGSGGLTRPAVDDPFYFDRRRKR